MPIGVGCLSSKEAEAEAGMAASDRPVVCVAVAVVLIPRGGDRAGGEQAPT